MEILLFLLLIIGIKSFLVRRKFNRSMYRIVSGNSIKRTFMDKGNYGEYLTFLKLEKLEENNKLLCNLYIPKEDGTTTEIDLVMINKSGIYVFESKNYSGWIFGDEKSKNWTQCLKGGRKNQFFNPIWQNKGHISALTGIIKEVDERYFYSYVIFSERCEIKKVSATSPRLYILKRNELLTRLKRDIDGLDKVLSEEQVYKVYYELLKYCRVNKLVREEHIEAIKAKREKKTGKKENLIESKVGEGMRFNEIAMDSIINKDKISSINKSTDPVKEYGDLINISQENREETRIRDMEEVESLELLRNKLKEYRVNVARLTGTKPYFIFSNETLEEMIKKKPMSKEELLKIKGIGPNKIEKYGEDIINILLKEGK